jgi:hypothetical protein
MAIKILPFTVSTILILALISLHSSARAEDVNAITYPIDSKPFGLTYKEWTVKWYQWFLATPVGHNPPDQDCAQSQTNVNVWFLGGAGSGTLSRGCTIPAGKAIFGFIANNECSNAEYPNLKTEPELKLCAVKGNEVNFLEATVDGIKLKDLNKYRVQSSLFNATMANNNVFGAPAGPTKAVSDGYWLFLKPLSVGNHIIHVKNLILADPATGKLPFVYDTTFSIKVVK